MKKETFIFIFPQIIIPRLGWRWLLALSSVPCFAALIFYFLTLESPRYLVLKGRTIDAHNILKKMAQINRTELPPGSLVSSRMGEMDEESTPSEDTQLLPTGKYRTEIAKPGFSSLFTLLSPSLVKTTLLVWIVYFGNSFSYYGVILMTSEFSSGQTKCGEIITHTNQLTDSSLYRNVFITSFAGTLTT